MAQSSKQDLTLRVGVGQVFTGPKSLDDGTVSFKDGRIDTIKRRAGHRAQCAQHLALLPQLACDAVHGLFLCFSPSYRLRRSRSKDKHNDLHTQIRIFACHARTRFSCRLHGYAGT